MATYDKKAFKEIINGADFTELQVTEIHKGFDHGLTAEQISVYANAKYGWEEMQIIRHAFEEGLTMEQIEVFADPNFSYDKMNEISLAFQSGLTIEQVKKFAAPWESFVVIYKMRKQYEKQLLASKNPEYNTNSVLEVVQKIKENKPDVILSTNDRSVFVKSLEPEKVIAVTMALYQKFKEQDFSKVEIDIAVEKARAFKVADLEEILLIKYIDDFKESYKGIGSYINFDLFLNSINSMLENGVFRINRLRMSKTDGEVVVYCANEKIAQYGDAMWLRCKDNTLSNGTKHIPNNLKSGNYGEILDGWGSIKPDEYFVQAAIEHFSNKISEAFCFKPEYRQMLKDDKLDLKQKNELRLAFEEDLPIKDVKFMSKPEFDDKQMQQIRLGFENNLTAEQIDIYAKPRFDNYQMYEIRRAFIEGLSMEQVNVFAKSEFDGSQMNVICSAFKAGLTEEQIKVLVNPEFNWEQMDELRKAFEHGLTMDQVSVLANPDLDCSIMSEMRLGFEDGLTSEHVTFFATPELDKLQRTQIREGFENGLSVEDVSVYAKPELSWEQMREIRWGLEHGLTIEQVQMFAKIEFNTLQMQELREVLENQKH